VSCQSDGDIWRLIRASGDNVDFCQITAVTGGQCCLHCVLRGFAFVGNSIKPGGATA
jgi:hypothetical protein